MLHAFNSPLFVKHGIKHGFFSRLGGFSHGVFASLNCSVKSADSHEHIAANLQKVARHFGHEEHQLQLLHQDHTNKVVLALQDRKHQHLRSTSADGMVSANVNILLGVYTADCTPILLYDKVRHIKAALHVSWRTAANNIIHNGLELMQQQGAVLSDVIAAIGPAIQGASYQVGDDVRQEFLQQDDLNALFFNDDAAMPNKYFFDLPKYCEQSLLAYGVKEVDNLRIDTYSDEKHFFSFRRSTHQNWAQGISQPPKVGGQLSVVG